jgi:cation diffusion facilitator family transporter
LISILAAGLLVALKLTTGIVTGSLGLISAGIESSGDVVAAVLTFFALRLAQQPADREHPFGHGRVENLSALGEAAILIAGGAFILTEGITRLHAGGQPPDAAWYSFAVIAVALVVDASRTLISLRTARTYSSAALRSNAFHFAGDLVGSLAVLVGLVLVRLGLGGADSVAALFVAALVFAAAARLVWENSATLMDRAPAEVDRAVRAAIGALGLPLAVRRVRVRDSGGRAFADVVVGVPPAEAVGQGHATADAIERAVERAVPGSDVVVHIEPGTGEEALRERVLAAALGVPGVREAHNVNIYELDGEQAVSLHVKLPATLSIAEASAVARQVEEAVRGGAPNVGRVQTHLEPLSEPHPARRLADATAGAITRRVRELALARSGREPVAVEVLATDVGAVVFLTIGLDPRTTLAQAHRLASALEEDIQLHPNVADVIVETRPAPRPEPPA